MVRSTITRTGRQRIALTAGPVAIADVLADLDAVGVLLGSLLDQPRCTGLPDRSWALPPIGLGLRSLVVVAIPHVTRIGDDIEIRAISTPQSDATVDLTLGACCVPRPAGGTELTTSWRLELGLPVRRSVMSLMTPALDHSVRRIVADVMRRTSAAVG
jgi:hypothetical protein